MKAWEKKSTYTVAVKEEVVKQEESANGGIHIEHNGTPERFTNGVKREPSSARSTPRRGASSTPVSAASLGRSGSLRGRGKKAPTLKPYEGKFEATLTTDEGPARFEMRDMREGIPEDERLWSESVHCLICQSLIE